MDNNTKKVIMWAAIVGAGALVYYLVLRPEPTTEFEACYNKCIESDQMRTSNPENYETHCIQLCGYRGGR